MKTKPLHLSSAGDLWKSLQAARPGAASLRALTCPPALPCPAGPARRTGEGEKTMEPDRTQIKLDPR